MTTRNMSRSLKLGLITLAIVILAVLGIAANRPGAGRFGRAGGWAGGGESGSPGSFDRMLATLDLSADQKAKVQAVIDAHQGKMTDLWFDHAEARKLVERAIRQPGTDPAAIKTASAKRADAELAVELERAKTWSEIYPLLTDAQHQTITDRQAKFQQHSNKIGDRKAQSNRPGAGGFMSGRMFGHLDLTDAQQAQFQTIMTAHQDNFAKLHQDDRAANAQIRSAVLAPVFDAQAVQNACSADAAAHEGMALERVQVYTAAYALLTDAQKAQLEHRRERFQQLQKL